MTGKRLLLVFVTILAIMALVVLPMTAGCSEKAAEPAAPAAPAATEPAPAETIELRFVTGSQGLNPNGVFGRVLMQWNEEVEAESGGAVKMNVLTGAAPDPELFDVVAKGAGDIAYNPIMLNTGRFPTMEAVTVPDIGIVCRHPSLAVRELWQSWPQIDKEFGEAKVLAFWCATQTPPGISFATIDKPIYTLEDFQGFKIGKYGEWGTKTLAALGAVPVAVPPNEVYEALQRKIVDGSCMDPEMLEADMIYELVKYWHNMALELVPVFFVINWDTWNSLPADVQAVIEEASARIPDRVDADFRESTVRALETGVKEYGMEVIEYSEEELDRWRARQQPVQDEYMAMLEKKGIDGNKLFADIKSLEDKYAEW